MVNIYFDEIQTKITLNHIIGQGYLLRQFIKKYALYSAIFPLKVGQRPRPSGWGLKKGNNSLAASIPTLPGGALKGGGKSYLVI